MFHTLKNWLRHRKANRLTQEITDRQWQSAEAPISNLFAHLGVPDKQRLRALAMEFLVSKQMAGARGLRLKPSVQLSIALQACLPILNLGLEWYEGWIGIIVYPGDFIIPREEMDEYGIVHEFDDVVLGEAWHNGPVLISWFDDMEEAGDVQIVIHEFAHKLDMRNGLADGFPPLHADMSRQAWKTAFTAAFEDFRHRTDRGEETGLDIYGSEAPAEFFAVMSEAFFARPGLLRKEYPEVYGQLEKFYRQSPLKENALNEPAAARTGRPESRRN